MSATNKSLFYNSENGDRVYDADSFEHLLKKFFTSGVFTGNCQVSATTGMGVSVSAGYANTDGKIRFFDEATALTLDNSHGTYNRIDTIVVERNDTNREITLKVVKGTNATDPTPTEPVRTGGIYQLVLAEVYVHAGATSITDAVITDKRPDTDVCGYVICAVETPDFSELFAQFQAEASEFIDTQSDEFLDWFDEMKDQLSEDAAGHLQLEIGTLSSLETTDKTDLVSAINENNTQIAKMSEGMTYVVNGNKSIEIAAIPVGSYVRLVNSTIAGRSDGIYTVKTAIPVDTIIDSSYFNESAPIAGGVANALNSKIICIDTGVLTGQSVSGNSNITFSIDSFIPAGYVPFSCAYVRNDTDFPSVGASSLLRNIDMKWYINFHNYGTSLPATMKYRWFVYCIAMDDLT